MIYATETEGVKFAFYQLKDVANIWYIQWEESHGGDVEPTVWDKFESAFLNHFFPRELREAKVKVLNLNQEGMTVKECIIKFIQLSRYAPKIVLDMKAKMRKFMFGLRNHVKKECKALLLISNVNISRIIVYAQ